MLMSKKRPMGTLAITREVQYDQTFDGARPVLNGVHENTTRTNAEPVTSREALPGRGADIQ